MKGGCKLPRALADFTVEEYRQLKYKMLTDQQIAEKKFIYRKTLHEWKKRVGINDKKRTRKLNHLKVRELREKGYSYSSIAARFGCTDQAVRYALK
jgi:hypothetical protein